MVRHPQSQSGFTLIELLVVIAIIGVLSAVVIGSLTVARERARNSSYVGQIRQYQNALALHFNDNTSYPVTGGGWVCIGTGFRNGYCWGGTYSETSAASVAFRADLAPYIDSTTIPGPKTTSQYIYGPMYRSANGRTYDMYMIFEGSIDCPAGGTASHQSGETLCLVTGIGG